MPLLERATAMFHVALGHTYPEDTGADWDSNIHCDMVMQNCSIEVDCAYIMKDGKFVPELLPTPKVIPTHQTSQPVVL